MRHFTLECKDNQTKLSMVLSECSYNMAMDWLQREAEKNGSEIFRVVKVTKGWFPLTMVEVGIPHRGMDYTGQPNVWYGLCRKFYYDEDRGLLLAD